MTEQDMKDAVYERLQSRSRFIAASGCTVYTGCGDEWGGLIRIGGKLRRIVRAAAWVFYSGFLLEGEALAYHRCKEPCCFCYEHIRIADSRSEVAVFRRKRHFGGARLLSPTKARTIRLQATTMSVTAIGSFYDAPLRIVEAVLRNDTYVEYV